MHERSYPQYLGKDGQISLHTNGEERECGTGVKRLIDHMSGRNRHFHPNPSILFE